MRPYGKATVLEKRRRRAVRLIVKEGYSQVEVSKKLGVHPRSVRLWMHLYRKKGDAGLNSSSTPGRPCRLDQKAKLKLRRILLKGAKAAGYTTDLWSCARVSRAIEREFGVCYHVDHIGRLLHLLGFSSQKPQRRAVERNEGEIQRWIQVKWPKVKKKPGK